MKVLAGDIGGTNTRLAIFAATGDGGLTRLHERRYASTEHEGPVAVLREFLRSVSERPERVCLGIACPVEGDVCAMPNLDWVIDAGALADELRIPRPRLINDFLAIGHALPVLGEDEVEPLHRGHPDPEGIIGILGAGTGLGVGFVVPGERGRRVHASEGGHADFPARTPEEWRLQRHLRETHGRVSMERVLSGSGLVEIYRHLRDEGVAPEDETVRRQMETGDPARVITDHGLERDDALCDRAIEIFIEAYGAAAGNLALTLGARGGFYLAGGIAPALLPRLREGGFLRAFRDKGRLSDYLDAIPVHVITTGDAGLIGAAVVATEIP